MARRGKNEGTIRKRKDGRWEARVTTGYISGAQKRHALYGSTREEVSHKMRAFQDQQQRGLPQLDERETVEAFLDTWLKDVASATVRPSTFQRYEQIVRDHLKPDLGHIRLAKLTPEEVQRLVKKKHQSGLTARSVQQIHAVLRSALNTALQWGKVHRNVAVLVRLPSVPKTQIEPLDITQSKALLAASSGDRLEALYAVAVTTGVRKGELLGLQWDRVDLAAGTIRVSAALQRVGGKPQLVEPKSSTGHRTIKLPEMTRIALTNHQLRQGVERLKAGESWQEQGYVFTTRNGTPLDPSNVSQYFKRILKKAEIPDRRFHDLRHTFATLMAVRGKVRRQSWSFWVTPKSA